jgi:secondary thiamine-phosphate synthase enzyme
MRFELRTHSREAMVDITGQVRDAIARSGVATGHALVYCPHTTAGITINEAADPDVAADILAGLARLVPADGPWRHAEGNSDAHLKATLVGSGVMVPVADGRPLLGTWQGVFFCEFDGPRTRSVSVTVHAG